MSQLNSQILNAIHASDIPRARELLRDALKEANAETFFLASLVALDDEQKREFLQKALDIDPFHENARQSLLQSAPISKDMSTQDSLWQTAKSTSRILQNADAEINQLETQLTKMNSRDVLRTLGFIFVALSIPITLTGINDNMPAVGLVGAFGIVLSLAIIILLWGGTSQKYTLQKQLDEAKNKRQKLRNEFDPNYDALPIKDGYTVSLIDTGPKKIAVINVIRSTTKMSLQEAKRIADTPPQPIATGLSEDRALKLQRDLEDVDATVRIT